MEEYSCPLISHPVKGSHWMWKWKGKRRKGVVGVVADTVRPAVAKSRIKKKSRRRELSNWKILDLIYKSLLLIDLLFINNDNNDHEFCKFAFNLIWQSQSKEKRTWSIGNRKHDWPSRKTKQRRWKYTKA